jgi:hypothetical protein
MIEEKTITILGKELKMRYCAGTETGYEFMSGKSASVFIPEIIEKDKKGNPTKIEQKANEDDFIKLAVASINSAYNYKKEKLPIDVENLVAYILYEADCTIISDLITNVIELRNKWYKVPETIPDSEFEENEGEQGKNVPQPANDSSDS